MSAECRKPTSGGSVGDPQEMITGFWSSIASGYEQHPGNVPEPGSEGHARWVETLAGMLPEPPAAVLDVATGTGFLALLAASLGHRVTGVDLADGMLAEARRTARERGLTVDLLEGDAVEPPFPPASFDAVTSRHLLWTLREPERALGAWRSLVRPDGQVVAFDGFWFAPPSADEEPPAEPGPFERWYTPETKASLPFFGIQSVDPVVEAFRAAGFSSVDVRELPELADPAASDLAPYVVVARP